MYECAAAERIFAKPSLLFNTMQKALSPISEPSVSGLAAYSIAIEVESAITAGHHRIVAAPSRFEQRIGKHDGIQSAGAELSDFGGCAGRLDAKDRLLK